MLQQLHIRNYALIDEIKIKFSGKLNIITGETGAGKSILMGALGLVLGERADLSALWQKDTKCFVEADFKTDHEQVQEYLKINDLDTSNEITVRREISSNGKSRAFINDTPVTLAQLKSFASLLVDLHQQFDTLELGDQDFQREVIDALANNKSLLLDYHNVFSKYIKARQELEQWKQQQANSNKELDYHRFLFDELKEASFTDGEIEQLTEEIKVLSHAEEIKAGLSGIIATMVEAEQPLVPQIKSISNQLHTFSKYNQKLEPLVQRISSVHIELQDIADELELMNDRISFNADKLDKMNERLSTGYRLMKKHGVTATAELLSIQKDLENKLDQVVNLDEKITSAEKQIRLLHQDMINRATILSEKRQKQIKPFEDKVNKLLTQVGMPNAKIKVSLQSTDPSLHGTDEVVFLFDANKTGRFEPLQKVASGGELSRLMLSIKSLIAKSVKLPVLIFDEIDTGISGEAAKQVGVIMKDLSSQHQVIAITHQPQIAARADAHYFVYKEVKGSNIASAIRVLEKEERIDAIAKMLGGEKPSTAAVANAKEMVENN
jgi:DNA repair protein RecN (Recombination protein N)